jgi:hypothetical protein
VPGVGAVEVAEVGVAGDLASEGRAGVSHTGLEEGVSDPVDLGSAAGSLDDGPHSARGADVVEHQCARFLTQYRLREQGREEVAHHELAGVVMKKQRFAPPSQGHASGGQPHVPADRHLQLVRGGALETGERRTPARAGRRAPCPSGGDRGPGRRRP